MANIKSAKKRARQAIKRRTRNRYYKITARTYVKQARILIQAGDLEEGSIHKNNASRRKSRLMTMFNKAKATTES